VEAREGEEGEAYQGEKDLFGEKPLRLGLRHQFMKENPVEFVSI